jgi:hypothetical protein
MAGCEMSNPMTSEQEFINELGNCIRIVVEGPSSTIESITLGPNGCASVPWHR